MKIPPGLDLELSYEVMEGVSYSGRGVASIVCSASVYIYPLRSPYGVQVWPSVYFIICVFFFSATVRIQLATSCG